MNSKITTQHQVLTDSINKCSITNANLKSNINNCKIPRMDGLIPNCCGDIIIFNQKAKDAMDEAQKELNRLNSILNKQ